MTTTEPTTTEDFIPESVLIARLGIPRTKLKDWRESGQLKEGEHWTRGAKGAHVITPEGERVIMELCALPVEVEHRPPVTVALRFICPGAMVRVARCRPVNDEGPMVSVRLTGARVFASQFRRGDVIQAIPTETEGIYEYDGGRPRRMRL